jgi:hypothetical protein
MYESIKELERKISEIRVDMANSNYPSEFGPLLGMEVLAVDGEYHYVSELLDTRPTLLYNLIDLDKIQISDNVLKQSFLSYIDDVRRMRVNYYCTEPKSWKEHYAAVSKNTWVLSDYNDNYSRHEMT